jgi:hypothetical protein
MYREHTNTRSVRNIRTNAVNTVHQVPASPVDSACRAREHISAHEVRVYTVHEDASYEWRGGVGCTQ